MARRKRKQHAKTRRKSHDYLKGRFEANPRGFGFVKTSAGEYFIPESKRAGAFDRDIVEISPLASSKGTRNKHGGRQNAKRSDQHNDRARVVRVLERAYNEVIGRYEIVGPFGIVVPDDPRIRNDIFTKHSDNPEIEDGSIVRVRILEYPTAKSSATGKVVEVLDGDANSLLIDRVIARHDLRTEFPEEALGEAESKVIDIDLAFKQGYRDIRDRFVFTIDPDDAKDFDDAISIEKVAPNKWRLGVHIADVSNYVGCGDAIDIEARERTTSVYLADRVVPMLPFRLSEDICSLRPHADRLCMTADLYIDDHANLLEADFYPAVMRSNMRLTYSEALLMMQEARMSKGYDIADILNRGLEEGPGSCGGRSSSDGPQSGVGQQSSDPGDGPQSGDEPHLDDEVVAKMLVSKLLVCSHMAKSRAEYRAKMGGLEFYTKEPKVILADDGSPVDIDVRTKNDATELIEEAMIFANEAVAEFLQSNDVPCAYRVHEPPAASKLSDLTSTLTEFKWFRSEDAAALKTASPFALQRILNESEGRAEQELVVMLLLRSMMRATYTPDNIGHYGLGLKCYCHFTSPIRRYPDLMIHRMLKGALGFSKKEQREQAKSLKQLCERSSEMERIAETASLDSQKIKMAQYMQSYIGEEFDAIIDGVSSYGFYVRLDNCVEGLVSIKLFDEPYIYDETRQTLQGVNSGCVFRLGQQVSVKLISVNVELAHIDFKLVD